MSFFPSQRFPIYPAFSKVSFQAVTSWALGPIFCVGHPVTNHPLPLRCIPACEKHSLTSMHVFTSQVFIEHLLITANLK